MEPSLTKKERKALKREERKREVERASRKKKGIFLILWGGVILVAGALGYGGYYLLNSPEKSLGADYSVAVPAMEDRTHISGGSSRPDYNSNPPTSGPHDAKTTERGVHEEEVADEHLVHNLEHGEIWISYQPDIPESAIEELERITNGNQKTVLTPRASNEKDIALSSWGRLDTFDIGPEGVIDRKRIEDFIKRYKNKGPERMP